MFFEIGEKKYKAIDMFNYLVFNNPKCRKEIESIYNNNLIIQKNDVFFILEEIEEAKWEDVNEKGSTPQRAE